MRVTFGGVVANTLFALSWVSWLFMLAGAVSVEGYLGDFLLCVPRDSAVAERPPTHPRSLCICRALCSPNAEGVSEKKR